MTIKVILIYFLFSLIALHTLQAYKLNVPKVLLPFHSSQLISFQLEVKKELNDADHLCFLWSSSMQDVVTIQPVYDTDECSTKAIVTAVSKNPQRLSSIILAKETNTDKIIRCDVIVDRIESITIIHTTKQLFLEDSPERFTVTAFDSEQNTFTSISGLPFEWNIIDIESDRTAASKQQVIDSRNVLRMVKLSDSEYDVSETIKSLEKIGLYGHQILIEGVKTGTANVQAKIMDKYYDSMKTEGVRLLVVANILLDPSHPVYILIGSSIVYRVMLIKQTTVEQIQLPSTQYYFESKNQTCANFKQNDPAKIIGLNIGSTEIVLVDRNMKEYAEQYKQPTSNLYVVNANYLEYKLKYWRLWVFEVGHRYEIEINAFTDKNEQIYPSQDLIINAVFDTQLFEIVHQSTNGSYAVLLAKRPGQTVSNATLEGTLNNKQFAYSAKGQQEIELLDPIAIQPPQLVFAYISNLTVYEYQLQASGGSGSYQWQSKNTTIAIINSQNGYLRAQSRIGHTQIHVHDNKNSDIRSIGNVYVLRPLTLDIITCPIETKIGQLLRLKLKMTTLDPDTGRVLNVNDCSKIPFSIWIENENVFKLVGIEMNTDIANNMDTCGFVVLEAVNEGSTQIRVEYDTFVKEVNIYSYNDLYTKQNKYLLARHSSFLINIYGGPTTVSSGSGSSSSSSSGSASGGPIELFDEHVVIQNDDVVKLSKIFDYKLNRYNYRVECLKATGQTAITIKKSIKKSVSNQCPLEFEHKIVIECSKPQKLELSKLFNLTYSDVFNRLPKCPLTDTAYANTVNQLNVLVRVRDANGQYFDNFTSTKSHIKWTLNKMYMDLNVQDLHSIEINGRLSYYQNFATKSSIGQFDLHAYLDDLKEQLRIMIVDYVKVTPNQITIFNHPSNIAKLDIANGSGYFYTELDDKNLVKVDLNENNRQIQVQPFNMGNSNMNLYDYCSYDENHVETIHINVAGINTIQIKLNDTKCELNKSLLLYVQIIDEYGNYIQKSLFKLMNLKYKLINDNNYAYIQHVDDLQDDSLDEYTDVYLLKGLKIGTVSVQFEANLNEGPLIQSKSREINIYEPLDVQPKYLDLIVGSYYQLKINGGPQTDDTYLDFELTGKNLIEIYKNASLNALNVGNLSVIVRSIGLCTNGNCAKDKQIVYSQDTVFINIVKLDILSINAPIKNIKLNSRMPVHINLYHLNKQHELKPFNYATSKHLSYKWSLNNENLAVIKYKSSFKIVFVTRQTGTVRLTVQLTTDRNDVINNDDNSLQDSIDIHIFDELELLNLNEYTSVNTRNKILLTPGTQLTVKTNRDSVANRINYKLYYDDYTAATHGEDLCSNRTIQINDNGLLNVASTVGYCSVLLNVRVDEHFKRTQTSLYLIKVRPIQYVLTDFVSNVSLSESEIQLANGIETYLNVNFYDDIGDEFDLVNAQINTLTNRNDLIELSQQQQQQKQKVKFLLKTIKHGNNLILKLNNDYLDINIESLNFFQYLFPKTDKFGVFDVLYVDFTKLLPIFGNNLSLFGDLELIEVAGSDGYLLRKLSQNLYLCTKPGNTQVKLNFMLNLNMNTFLNLNQNSFALSVEPYRRVVLHKEQNNLDFNFNPTAQVNNVYEFKFDDHDSSLKFANAIGTNNEQVEFNSDYKPFECKFKLTDNSHNFDDYESLNKLFTVNLLFKSNKWLCELKFTNDDTLQHYYDLLRTIHKTPNSIHLWIEDKQNGKSSDCYTLNLFPLFRLNQLSQEAIDFEVKGEHNTHELSVSIVDYMVSCLDVVSSSSIIKIKKLDYDNFEQKYSLGLYLNALQTTTDIYLDIKCSLNGQHLKVPIKFLFKSLRTLHREPIIDDTQSILVNVLSYIQANTNQIITVLALFSLVLITLLFLMKTKFQPQSTASMNKSTAQRPQLNKSFDRYQTTFYKNLNVSNSQTGLRHRLPGALDDTTAGYSWSTPMRNDSQSSASVSPFGQSFSQNKSQDRIKLFSVDTDVAASSPATDNRFINSRYDN